MGCNVTRTGITRDLEEMKAAGIGGVCVFQLRDITTAGVAPITNNPLAAFKVWSREWWKLIGFAVSECHRLGLMFMMHNSPGWSGCGGPWVTPELRSEEARVDLTHTASKLDPLTPSNRFYRVRVLP